MRYVFTLLSTFLITGLSFAQNSNPLIDNSNPKAQKKWVDSVYASMSLNEKVGQLFMVQVMSNQDEKTKNKIVELIRDYHIGGIIYSNGGPVRQAKLNNELNVGRLEFVL